MHEQTIQEHVESNLIAAIDQSHEYDQFATYKEGDAYLQNTIDSCLEDGYSWDEASDAGSLFHKLATEKGVRFHGEETTPQTTEENTMPLFRIHTDEKQPLRTMPVVTADFFSDGYCGIDEADRKQIERWCRTAAVGAIIDTESVSVMRIFR